MMSESVHLNPASSTTEDELPIIDLQDWMGTQFQRSDAEKGPALLTELNRLIQLHGLACAGYGRYLAGIADDSRTQGMIQQAADLSHEAIQQQLSELPYLPVGVFKQHDLKSIPEDAVFRMLSSSGTTGQRTSRIFIDREAAGLQVKALSSVMTTLLGKQRLPMLIMDAKSTVTNRERVNARTAGVLGMMNFGRDHIFALHDDLSVDWPAVQAFFDRYAGQPVLMFGFTFLVWQSLAHAPADIALDLSKTVLVHGGGWKKLQDQAVDNRTFKQVLLQHYGLQQIHNFYGMIEQIGSIFLEDDEGWLHPPDFADFIIRDPLTLMPLPPGVPGVIECLSILPRSYPGHLVLTEDLGIWMAEDDRPGHWRGKRLRVLGRVPKTELRGCSDVAAASQPARAPFMQG